MTSLTFTQLLPDFLLAVTLMLLIACWVLEARLRAGKRARELCVAAEMLEEHYHALQVFMDDPASPETLKDVLMQFSDAAGDKEVAIAVAQGFALSAHRHSRDDNATLMAVEELAKHRPDLADTFFTSIAAGIMAMYCRWPETSKFRDMMMARVAKGRASEVSFATRTAKRSHRDDHNGDANVGGNLVAA